MEKNFADHLDVLQAEVADRIVIRMRIRAQVTIGQVPVGGPFDPPRVKHAIGPLA